MDIWLALVIFGLICSIIGIMISTIGLFYFYLIPDMKKLLKR